MQLALPIRLEAFLGIDSPKDKIVLFPIEVFLPKPNTKTSQGKYDKKEKCGKLNLV